MDWKNKDDVREYNRQYKRIHNSNKKYYEKHREEILKRDKEYREKNRDKFKEYREKNKDKIKERIKRYREEHKEEIKEYNKEYYLKNKERINAQKMEYNKEYTKTQMGRAQRQFQQYRFMDKRNNLGDVIDFNAKWIVEHIYTKHCVHCGETDWHKLGCNRIDNTKGHTKDNVECCCFSCNCRLNGIENGVKNLNDYWKARKHS